MRRFVMFLLTLLLWMGQTNAVRALDIQSGTLTPIKFQLFYSGTTSPFTGATTGSIVAHYSIGTGAASVGGGTITENGGGYYTYTPASGETTSATLPIDEAWYFTYAGATQANRLVTLVAYNPGSATNLGLSALPTVTAGAAGGLPTATNGSGQVVASNTLQMAGVTPLFDGSSYLKTNVQAITAGTVAPSGFFATASAPANAWFGNFAQPPWSFFSAAPTNWLTGAAFTSGVLPANFGNLAITSGGAVNLNTNQALDTSVLPLTTSSANSVGSALWSALGGTGVCKIVITGSTLSIYDITGNTLVRSFTISPAATSGSSRQ